VSHEHVALDVVELWTPGLARCEGVHVPLQKWLSSRVSHEQVMLYVVELWVPGMARREWHSCPPFRRGS
jgi:hypothetical protein